MSSNGSRPITPSGGAVRLVALTRRIDDVLAVDGIDLDIEAGEFFSLLGPSGCGKTTTLRLIAGFEPPTSGAILLDGTDLSRTPAHLRNLNMVFQTYALFPHLDVRDNVAYGLRWRKVGRTETRARVAAALDLVRLGGMARRRPAQLSGGEQQRVALARALVLRPSVLLLDEPLGSLDAKLRKELQVELKALQAQVGITFVFVTHDQEEALSMSDRIAVMRSGRVEQVGTPRTLYEEPATPFVANFLGASNVLVAHVDGSDGGGRWLRVGHVRVRSRHGAGPAGGTATIMVRPERVHLQPHDGRGGDNLLPAMVERTVYLGATIQVDVHLAGGATLQASVPNTGDTAPYRAGQPVVAYLPPDAIRVLGVDGPPSNPAPVGSVVEVAA
jgi:spermidine/putrescine transport system ATP-binding protein